MFIKYFVAHRLFILCYFLESKFFIKMKKKLVFILVCPLFLIQC
jgi:hypothetical protein